MSLRKSREWLNQQLAKTGLGYVENGERIKPGQILKEEVATRSAPVAKKARPGRANHYELSEDGIHLLRLKPLSVNKAWKGRRTKTDDYKQYEEQCAYLLPGSIDVPDGPLDAYFEWGVSSKLADYDNPVKPFQDILQKQYRFDDRRIVNAHISKREVPKGSEYIKFKLVSSNMESIFHRNEAGS